MPYIVSMLKCENRLYCAGKRPPSPPCYSFLSRALLLPLVGNHITTPCFFHSLRGRDGAMEPMQQHQHPMQLGCNLSPLLSSSSSSSAPLLLLLLLLLLSLSLSLFLSLVHASVQPWRRRACPIVQRFPSWGPGISTGPWWSSGRPK